MDRLISAQTAMDIALAYREVESAEKLLEHVRAAASKHRDGDIRDAFGRSQHGLQLGIPTGPASHQLFNVPFQLAIPVIEAHIAQQRAIIATLSAKAWIESEPPQPVTP